MALQSAFSDRLVQLADGRPGLRGAMTVAVREPRAGDATPSPVGRGLGEGDSGAGDNSCNSCLDFISSDETLDRYDEIISASGWNLATYQRNPVFQNAHQYGDIIFTLGKALVTDVRTVADRKVLFQRIQFATDVNPMARIAYGLYKGKFLNAVSVGFIPIRWEDGGAVGPASSLSLSAPGGEGRGEVVPSLATRHSSPPPVAHRKVRRRYLEQELLEVSAVGIPANPNALALAYKSGAVEKSDLRETLNLLRALCAVSSTHGTHGTPPLLALARELRNLLRH